MTLFQLIFCDGADGLLWALKRISTKIINKIEWMVVVMAQIFMNWARDIEITPVSVFFDEQKLEIKFTFRKNNKLHYDFYQPINWLYSERSSNSH